MPDESMRKKYDEQTLHDKAI